MDGRTHAAVGTAAALLVVRPTRPEDIVITASVGAFAALLADIDTGGKVSKYVRRITGVFLSIIAFFIVQAAITGGSFIDGVNRSGIAVNLLGLAMLITFSVYGGTQPHRGFTHSVVACAAASGCAYLVFKGITPAFVIGYASHLIADFPNKKGEQLLWPLPDRWSLSVCKSNGLAATVTKITAEVVSIGYLVYLNL